MDHRVIRAEAQKKSMIGQKFHKLTIVSHHSAARGYNCICECGNEALARPSDLRAGRRKSCGCQLPEQMTKGHTQPESVLKKRVATMIGRKFGSLTVVRHHSGEGNYECLCDCGKTTFARTHSLKSGRHKSCGCMPRKCQLPDHQAAKNEIYQNYVGAAARRGYVFAPSKKEFLDLISKACHYCGVADSLTSYMKAHPDFKHNGVDRVDNKVGYTIENCVPCCDICNRSKATLSLETWRAWVQRLNAHQKETNSMRGLV